MFEKSPCTDCSLRSIEQSDRLEACSSFVQNIVHEWWHGNPTMELHEVAMDHFVAGFHTGDRFNDEERGAMDSCITELYLGRCDEFNPYRSLQ